MADLPLLILMSGAPGSGKSSLARGLGDRLRMPVIEKDLLREATLWSLSSAELRNAPWGPGLWYPVLEALVDAGISVIGDMTLFRGVSEADIRNRLAHRARLVQVHCRCADPVARFQARVAADPLRRHHLGTTIDEIRALAVDLVEPLGLGCPTFVVDTTSGYAPDIDTLVSEIVKGFGAHLAALARPRDAPDAGDHGPVGGYHDPTVA